MDGNNGGATPTILERFMTNFTGGNKGGGQNQGGNGGQNNGQNPNQNVKPQNQSPNNQEVVTQNNSTNDPTQQQKSPLDEMSKVWETKKDKDGNEIKPTGPEPLFKPDLKTLGEAVSKMNFTSKLNPETVKKALAGDHDSFSQAVNSAAQEAFQQSLLASSQMMEGAFTKKMAEFQKNSETQFRTLRSSEAAFGKNPAFAHPAVKPMFEMMRDKFASQYPEASPQEIADHTENYFTQAFGAISGKGENTGEEDENGKIPGGPAIQKSQDWGKFFG